MIKDKVVQLHKLPVDGMLNILCESGGQMKNVLLAYELDGQLNFDHTGIDNRGTIIGLLEYAKHAILSED